ncbi:MAG: DUF481 domain-containing protein [Myxococcota bacterium]
MMKREWTFGRFLLAGAACGLLLAAGNATAGEEGWSGDVGVALTAQSGTQDTFAGSIDALGERTWAEDLATVRLTAVYGTSRNKRDKKDDREVIQNAQALFGDWKHTFTDRFFWQTGTELSRDSTTRRDVRFAVNTGPGYRTWQGAAPDAEHFDLYGGVGYRYEQYDGNANDGPTFGNGRGGDVDNDIQNLADLVAGFEYKNGLFEDAVEYTHTGKVFAPANDFNAFIARTEVLLGIPLTEAWSFRTGVLVEWVNDSPDNTDQLTTRTTVGLGYKF